MPRAGIGGHFALGVLMVRKLVALVFLVGSLVAAPGVEAAFNPCDPVAEACRSVGFAGCCRDFCYCDASGCNCDCCPAA